MKIVDLIGRDMIVPALAGTDKRSILEELAAHVARQQYSSTSMFYHLIERTQHSL